MEELRQAAEQAIDRMTNQEQSWAVSYAEQELNEAIADMKQRLAESQKIIAMLGGYQK